MAQYDNRRPNYDNHRPNGNRQPNGNRRNDGNSNTGQDEPKFGSPYNFVPINDDVLIPWWNELASQDAPLIDAESGKISLTVTNLSPMFIRDGGNNKYHRRGVDYDYSAHIMTPGGKRYFIPGSSLRGMIRSVAEILSFSRFDMFDDGYFGMRDFPKSGNANSAYKDELENVLCGWVRMEDEKLYLQPCGKPMNCEPKQDPDLSRELSANRSLNAIEKHDRLQKATGQRYPKIGGRHLVCTGDINRKDHEYSFGAPVGAEIMLSDILKKKFISVYKPSPYYDFIYNSLRKGEKIPVFYIEDAGRIKHLGVTRYYRIPYRYPISRCFDQFALDDRAMPGEGSDGNEVDIIGHDMTQTLFGYVDNDNREALKGRVWIDSAFALTEVDDSKLIPMMGVLGQPHASFYPRYLQQDDNTKTPYNTYAGYDGKPPTLAGRKRYRIHKNAHITALPQGNGNQNVMSKFMLLPAGVKFKLNISFHNIMPEEIGLLLSALTLHGTQGAHHNIGLAKGYGYGKLGITVDGISGLQHDGEYYLRFFEYYINNFTSLRYENECPWTLTPEIRTLMAIMSDHSEDLEMMILDDHKPARDKRNKDKVKLRERDIKVNSYLDSKVKVIDLSGLKLHNAIKSRLASPKPK